MLSYQNVAFAPESAGVRLGKMSLHDGHRQRKKQRFLQHGLDSFADHEVLELLLF